MWGRKNLVNIEKSDGECRQKEKEKENERGVTWKVTLTSPPVVNEKGSDRYLDREERKQTGGGVGLSHGLT